MRRQRLGQDRAHRGGLALLAAEHAAERGVRPRLRHRVEPAHQPQRQRVGGGLARPVEHARAGAAGAAQRVGERAGDTRGHGRPHRMAEMLLDPECLAISRFVRHRLEPSAARVARGCPPK